MDDPLHRLDESGADDGIVSLERTLSPSFREAVVESGTQPIHTIHPLEMEHSAPSNDSQDGPTDQEEDLSPLHSSILREYDIRGVFGTTLSEADAYLVGRAFGSMVARNGGSRICVGFDGRLSSLPLEASVIQGICDSGRTVIRIGRGPTPLLYFAVNALSADGGIMVTASHNPPEYNGFKFVWENAPFYGNDIKRLGQVVATGNFVSGSGSIEVMELMDKYIHRLVEDYRHGRDLKVAWDAGNGAAGDAMVRLCASLPGEHILINELVDGTFPAHPADPTNPDNLVQLIETVTSNDCDLGIAFDGDGDRIGVVDNTGSIVWGDQILMLMIAEVLDSQPGSAVIADVKASDALFEEVRRLGGRPLMSRTGHSPIKEKMKESGAKLAGEMSGHIFFADRYYGYDDALYAAVRLLSLISRQDRSFDQLVGELPKSINTPEIRLSCPDARKFNVIDEVQRRLIDCGADMNDLDGVRVRNEDGWWLLRASNTEDALVVRCESQSHSGLNRLIREVTEHLKCSGVDTGAGLGTRCSVSEPTTNRPHGVPPVVGDAIR